MTTPKDGGPAFPSDLKDFQPDTGQQVVREQFPGMTLRDYFMACPFTEYEICTIAYRLCPDEPSIGELHDGRYVVPASEVARRFAEARRILSDALLKAREV